MGNGPERKLGDVLQDTFGFQLGIGLLEQIENYFVESASQRFGRVAGVLGQNLALVEGTVEGALPDVNQPFPKSCPPLGQSGDGSYAAN